MILPAIAKRKWRNKRIVILRKIEKNNKNKDKDKSKMMKRLLWIHLGVELEKIRLN